MCSGDFVYVSGNCTFPSVLQKVIYVRSRQLSGSCMRLITRQQTSNQLANNGTLGPAVPAAWPARLNSATLHYTAAALGIDPEYPIRSWNTPGPGACKGRFSDTIWRWRRWTTVRLGPDNSLPVQHLALLGDRLTNQRATDSPPNTNQRPPTPRNPPSSPTRKGKRIFKFTYSNRWVSRNLANGGTQSLQ